MAAGEPLKNASDNNDHNHSGDNLAGKSNQGSARRAGAKHKAPACSTDMSDQFSQPQPELTDQSYCQLHLELNMSTQLPCLFSVAEFVKLSRLKTPSSFPDDHHQLLSPSTQSLFYLPGFTPAERERILHVSQPLSWGRCYFIYSNVAKRRPQDTTTKHLQNNRQHGDQGRQHQGLPVNNANTRDANQASWAQPIKEAQVKSNRQGERLRATARGEPTERTPRKV